MVFLLSQIFAAGIDNTNSGIRVNIRVYYIKPFKQNIKYFYVLCIVNVQSAIEYLNVDAHNC